MKFSLQDAKSIESFKENLGGVFSTYDLGNAFRCSGKQLYQRINQLVKNGILQRAKRGIYTTSQYDSKVLASKISPDSYLTMETVLSEELWVGSVAEYKVSSVKIGRPRSYRVGEKLFKFYSISPDLFMGYNVYEGIKKATPEKALLDCLYYYLYGEVYLFNLFTDVDLSKVNEAYYFELLNRYLNPKFKKFAYDYYTQRR